MNDLSASNSRFFCTRRADIVSLEAPVESTVGLNSNYHPGDSGYYWGKYIGSSLHVA